MLQNMLLQYLRGMPYGGQFGGQPVLYPFGQNLPIPFEGGNPMQPRGPIPFEGGKQPKRFPMQPGFSPRADARPPRPMNMMGRYGQEY